MAARSAEIAPRPVGTPRAIRRWWALTATRLSIAVWAMTAAVVTAEPATPVPAVRSATVLYLLAIGTIQLSAGGRVRPPPWKQALLVLIDGLYLALVVSATGGPAEPLGLLVPVHIAAVALTGSARSGFEAAAWHSALLLVAPSTIAGALDHPLASGPSDALGRAAGYLAIAGGVVGLAAIDRRALRERETHLAAQVALMARLDRATSAQDTCLALSEHVVGRLGFGRAVTVLESPTRLVAARTEYGRRGARFTVLVDAAPGFAPRARDPHRSGPGPIGLRLDRRMDPDVDPLLDRLLPDARNVVSLALRADGQVLGVVAGEWRGGRRARLPHSVGDRLVDDAFRAGAALQSVLLRDQVEQRSRRDLLTGLANRRGFDEALDRELARSSRTGEPLSVILVDLDRFKAVNDTLGHQAGDEVLASAGRALGAVGRGHDLAARIGGDEFALLAPASPRVAAAVMAERARRSVVSAVGGHGVSASIGLACAPGQGNTAGALVRAADEALYEAKSSGRNRVAVSRRTVTRDRAPGPGVWSPRRRRIQPAAPGLGTGRFRDARPGTAAGDQAAASSSLRA